MLSDTLKSFTIVLNNMMSDDEIFLIDTPSDDIRKPMQNLGLVSIASYADDNGYAGMTKIIDGRLLSFKHGLYKAKKIISQTIKKEKPLIVGFPTYQQSFNLGLKDLIKSAQEVNSEIVFGGNLATALHTLFAHIGIVVRGEGEVTFKEVLDAKYNGKDLHKVKGITFDDGKEVVVNPDRKPVDINNLSFPDWGLLPPVSEYNYRISIEDARDCVHNCSFCGIMIYKNRKKKSLPRLKTIERIGTETEFAYLHDATYIRFVSELVLFDRERALKIADIMDKYRFKWGINAHPTFVVKQEDILPILKSKGLYSIETGVEAGSQSILNYYNKQTTPETNSRAIKAISNNGIKPRIDFINFHPDITMRELGENINFIEQHLDFFFTNLHYPHQDIFKTWIPIIGTPIYEKLLKERRITVENKNLFGSEAATYANSDVVKVLRLIAHYVQNHNSRYEMIEKRIKEKNNKGLENDSLSEREKRLKYVPFYVLCLAYSCAKDGKSMEESKSAIDVYCQKEFTALSQETKILVSVK